ncbi:hypothetical protein [Pseudomonas asiatica]|uniref:hypothetical protein n=1 Tax=Pseudomonas asiatica TaxID=2219225 RepID=UPI002AC89667|nr:hypothetical protein [Pseudomonas asiatica]WPX87718.1 hypothetical protein PsasTeo6_15424 [Pseudomonas asiatica]
MNIYERIMEEIHKVQKEHQKDLGETAAIHLGRQEQSELSTWFDELPAPAKAHATASADGQPRLVGVLLVSVDEDSFLEIRP